MRTPLSWFVLLATICIVAPYLLGVRQRDGRDWRLMATTLGFLAWLLAGFASVISR